MLSPSDRVFDIVVPGVGFLCSGFRFVRPIQGYHWIDRLLPNLNLEFRFVLAVESAHPLLISQALVFGPVDIAITLRIEDHTMDHRLRIHRCMECRSRQCLCGLLWLDLLA